MKKRDFQIPYKKRNSKMTPGDVVVCYNFKDITTLQISSFGFPHGTLNIRRFIGSNSDFKFIVTTESGKLETYDCCGHFLSWIKIKIPKTTQKVI